MKSIYRSTQLFRSWQPRLALGILALMAGLTGPAALRTLAEVSLELAQISLSLCQIGLVLLRVWGI